MKIAVSQIEYTKYEDKPIIHLFGRDSEQIRHHIRVYGLNPFFYISEGYRYTFLEQKWFYEFPEMNLYFWLVTLMIFIAGVMIFKKLKPEFGDIL